ncbi:hypothetical protein EC990672_0299B, partial [Escherichia coli 99.0672]
HPSDLYLSIISTGKKALCLAL